MTATSPQRRILLVSYLALVMIKDLLQAGVYLLQPHMFYSVFPSAPAWAATVFGLLSFVDLVCLLAIWGWRKWGLYGLSILTVLTWLLNALSNIPLVYNTFSFVELAIIAILLRANWRYLS